MPGRQWYLDLTWPNVGDLSYILIGSAGTELKAKNISKKSLSHQKTVSLLVSISFQWGIAPIWWFKGPSLIYYYCNFLLFFRSRVPLIFRPGTLLSSNSNSDARRSFSRHAKITWLTLATLILSSNSDARRSRDSYSRHAAVTWRFADRVSDSALQNPEMALFQAQIEIDPKMATQADSLFGSAQTLVSLVVMTTLGCAWLCKAV